MALDRDRYHELLGGLWDGELSDAQTEELARMLSSQPEWQRDFRQHLVLWDLWAQLTTPERSAAAFVAWPANASPVVYGCWQRPTR